MISIRGLNKAAVLQGLYNAARPASRFPLGEKKVMTLEQAEKIMKETKNWRFDYMEGRCLKVDLSRDEFRPNAYDRDNGNLAAITVIERLYKEMEDASSTEHGKAE